MGESYEEGDPGIKEETTEDVSKEDKCELGFWMGWVGEMGLESWDKEDGPREMDGLEVQDWGTRMVKDWEILGFSNCEVGSDVGLDWEANGKMDSLKITSLEM